MLGMIKQTIVLKNHLCLYHWYVNCSTASTGLLVTKTPLKAPIDCELRKRMYLVIREFIFSQHSMSLCL